MAAPAFRASDHAAGKRRWLSLLPLLAFSAAPAAAQERTAPRFIELQAAEGSGPVALAVAQAVRVGRLENVTVVDTTTFVQLQTRESVEAVARRLIAAGLPMMALTDLAGVRTYIATDRVVSVRAANERHAPGARTSLIVDGLRFSRDMAVRESMPEVMAALGGAVPGR